MRIGSNVGRPSDNTGSGPQVLVVDDRPEILSTIEEALAPLPARVLRAVTPQAAIELVGAHQFAVALIDAQMAGLDARELARRLNDGQVSRTTPIIFITGLEEDRRKVHAEYETGAVDYLFSPIDPGELRAKVGTFVRLYREHESEAARERRRFADLSGEAARIAAERRAAMILESITDAFYALDADFRFTYVNRRAEQLWGRRREELVGRHIWTEFPSMVGSESYECHLEAMSSREPAHYETRSPILNRWVETNLYPEPAGGLACYLQDVTDRKSAEADRERLLRELEAERTQLATIFRDAPAFLAVLRGRPPVFELVNDAYYQLVGHRELIGRALSEALPEVRDQGFEQTLDRVLETGEPFIGREVPILLERVRGAVPEQRFLDFTYLPLSEPDGTRSGVVAYGLDVTDHVAARIEVERARDRISALQRMTAALASANTPDAVAEVVVAQGMAATSAVTALFVLRDPSDPMHASAVRAVGIPDDLVQSWSSFSTTEDGPAALSLRTGDACFIESGEELRQHFPSLSELWDQLEAQALATVPMNVSGQTLGAMSFTFRAPRTFTAEDRDFFRGFARQAGLGLERARLIRALTHEREMAVQARTEAELARAEWEQAASAKGQFLATMSHELRTPINAQIGYTQLLQLGIPGPLTAEQREYLERLGRNSEHLLALVNDVLDLSKIEAHQLAPSRDDALTGSAVDAALDVVRPLADARGIRISDSRPNPAGVPYVGDEQRVRQILVNLLSNSVKFTEPGGSIQIDCRTEAHAPEGATLHGRGPWARVSVQDSGIGIDPAQFTRIFEPFHQVQSGHTRTQGGTGLGLAISRRLARLMGGDLTVESKVGEGSTFTLWLPAIEQAGDDVSTATESAERRRRRAEPHAESRAGAFDSPGAERMGEVLRAAADEILAAYVHRLRTDPETPLAHVMKQPELEDHFASLLADVSQTMFIISQGGPEASELLRDGSAIQRTIAEHHGRRRYAQQWTEAALMHDVAILREEVERVVTARVRMTSHDADLSVDDGNLDIMLGLLDRMISVSLRAWRAAAQA